MNKHEAALAYLRSRSNRILIPPRLMALLYLADWESCLDWGRQITDVRWSFIDGMPSFTPPEEDEEAAPQAAELGVHDRMTLDRILQQTNKLGYEEFEKLVATTIPAMLGDTEVDLVLVAAAYHKVKLAA